MRRVGDYEILDTLGEGAYSTVKSVRHIPTGNLFVAKIIQKRGQNVENDVKSEISVLRRLKHRNIVQLIEILESTNNFYIILEAVMGGDLCDLITSLPETLPEKDVAALLIQLISGVRACHVNGVAHRDLKPENLLLSVTGVLKISDFGLSRLHRDGTFHHSNCDSRLTGTLAYLAPEVFTGMYDAYKADIWSVGCILYVLLTHHFPFGSAADPDVLQRRIVRGEVTKMPSHVSSEAKDLCLWLLAPHPDDRPSLDEAARHVFFTNNIPSKYLTLLGQSSTSLIAKGDTEEFSSMLNDDGLRENTQFPQP